MIALSPEEALYAAYIRQAIADWLILPHHTKHWQTARDCLRWSGLLTPEETLDTRGHTWQKRTRQYTGRNKA